MPNAEPRHPASVIHLAARLRALLGLTTGDLALVVGVDARTLTRMETWSGSLLTAIRTLAETSKERAPGLVVELASLHARRNPDPPDPAELASLGKRAEAALGEFGAGASSALLLELCAKPLPWIYWATSARAGDTTTRDLADHDGLIVRPLLQGEVKKKEKKSLELHSYLLALRPGDSVLLCHDATPVAWYELQPSDDQALTELARQRLRHRSGSDQSKETLKRAATNPASSSRYLELVDALPAVFRHVELASLLGKRLAANGYHLVDNSPATARTVSGWFSGLCVAPLPEEPVPSLDDFARRPAGERARMTRFRRPPK